VLFGLPAAVEVAQALDAPIGGIVLLKLVLPTQPEAAIGAIGWSGMPDRMFWARG